MSEQIVVSVDGHVGTIRLNRPEALNALGIAMMLDLEEAWTQLGADDRVRVILVTGTGRAFCTGVDVKELAAAGDAMKDYAKRVRGNRLGLTSLHCDVWKPVLCAVNGLCAGGGLHFVADSDIVIAADTAEFTDPHVSVGQVAAWEPVGLLRRGWPLDVVSQLLFGGRSYRLPATEARQRGLIADVVPAAELDDRARTLAASIARNSPSAMMESKRVLWSSMETGLTAALDAGARVVADFWSHPDNREGPRAFAEKRPPDWQPPSSAGKGNALK